MRSMSYGLLAPLAGLCLASSAAAGELRELSTNSAIETYIESVAISEMEKQVEQQPFFRKFLATAAAPGGGGAGAGHSTTNNQVAGVDEPDFVKTDGEYIYRVVGEYLVILDAIPARSMREVGRIKVDGYANAIFLNGTTVMVFSTPPAPASMERPNTGTGPWGGYNPGGPVLMKAMFWPGPQGTPVVKCTSINVRRPAAPRVSREYYLEGSFVDARMVGTQVHMVTSSRTPGPELVWWQDWSVQPTTQDLDRLKTENRRRIRAATLSDWLPRQLDPTLQSRPSLAPRSGKTFKPEFVEGRNILTISTMDLASPYTMPQHCAAIAESGEVFASASALYVACYRYRYWSELEVGGQPGDVSDLHRFRIGGTSGPAFDASGQVEGRILNQFSMDEYNGTLRVATTTEQVWDPVTGAVVTPQKNHVFALRRLTWWGRRLYTIGSIRDLAPTERIYACRFMGDRGYVVTFRQVDPLFAIDMKTMTVKGDVKVDGFSTYLHPLGPNHLLAVGNAADANGVVTGLDVTIFDVSNLTTPRLVHRRTLAGAYSQSLYEHKAFTYYEANGVGTLAIPMNQWQGPTPFSGLEVYDISLSRGINLRGRVDHADLAQQAGWGMGTTGPDCSRSIVIGWTIYSVSDVGIKANRLLNPATEYSSVLLKP